MKSRFLKIGLCIVILVSLLALSFAMVRPVYIGLGNFMRSKLAVLNATLNENFGVNISYSSLSPSILTGIKLKGIEVKDSQTSETILTIKKVTVDYSLSNVLKGDFENAVSKIIINEVNADVTVGKNTAWIDYLISKNLEKKKDDADTKSIIEILADADINIEIPANININNVTLKYRDDKQKIDATAFLRKAYVEKTLTKGKYAIQLFGQLSGNVKSNKLSTFLYVESSLLQKLNNSSAVIQLFNANLNNYGVNQIGFLAEYNDAVFTFKMLPTVQNLYTEVKANFKTRDADLKVFSDNFKVSQLVRGIQPGSAISKVSYLSLTSRITARYNWDSAKVNYNGSGSVYIPDGIVAGGLNVKFACNGNQNYINIPYVNALSETIDVGFAGGYNIRAIQPEGVFSVNKLQLNNEGVISAEIFFEPLAKGFMAFSPQIMFDEKSLTAAMFNFIPSREGFDYDFEIYDYSHAESGDIGHLTLIGNYVTASKFFQSNLNLDGLYIDSLMQLASFFMDKNTGSLVNDFSSVFKSTIFTTDVYISSYDGNYSYSIPSAIIADTARDNRMLMFALDGNKENIQLTKFELAIDDSNVYATAHVENLLEPGTNIPQTILAGMVEYNNIPYGISGLINKDYISITGDYGLNFTFINDHESDNLLGNFNMLEFPVKLSESTLSFTADASFFYNSEEKINVNLNKFEILSMDGVSQINPVFDFSGRVDKTGAYLETISYADSMSNLSGNGSVIWNFENSNFVNADYNIVLQDPWYAEKIEIKGNVTNPDDKPFSTDALLKDFYVTSEINVNSFKTGRFTGTNNPSETVDANISITGNLGNPLVSISVPHGLLVMNNKPAEFSLQASIVDLEFEISSAELVLENGITTVNNVSSKFSFVDWEGFVNLDFQTIITNKTINVPVRATIKSIKSEEKKKSVPEIFEIDIVADKIDGTFIHSSQAVSIHALKMPDEIIISSSPNLGLSGKILSSGEVDCAVNNNIPCNFKISGNIKKNFAIHFYDFNVDVVKTVRLVDFDMIKFYSGKIIGDFWIKSNKKDLVFDGLLMLLPAELAMPQYFTAHAKTDIVYFYFEKNRIYTPKTRFSLKKSPVDITLDFNFLPNFQFDFLNVLVDTVDDAYVPVNINLNQIHVKGNVQADLEITVELDNATVLGSIAAKDTTAEFGTSTIKDVVTSVNQTINPESKPYEKNFDVEVMLDVSMKNRVQVYYSSFIRGLVVPNSKVTFAYSSIDDRMTIDGGVPLRSGEIIYLNSSFYIKEGRIDFSEKDPGFDPYVTIRAETREKDDSNNDVTISLGIDHQRISELAPKLTSSPAKSEKEIMELLGNFVTANSENMTSFMLATGDYALQTLLIRKVENALRDFLNFDILSIRTQVVQNALKYSMDQSSERQGINVSNFFDNTTVYIGKYFGNALYADAMVRLSYNKNRINDGSTLQGLVFKPEIGFEMDSPLAKIRWSLAPDLSDLARNNITIIPSLTLSWKLNF